MQTLKLYTKQIILPLVQEYAFERRIRHALLVLIVALAIGYGYFVSAAVLHVIARKNVHVVQASIQSDITALESEYFTLSNKLSVGYAASLGFIVPEDKHYVPRTVQYASAHGIERAGF